MSKLCSFVAVLFLSCISHANNYYFSTTSGNDTRTALQAQNPVTPWKTIGKLNSSFSTFLAGDSILFCRGDSFPGSLLIQKSGTAAKPIVFSAYGSTLKGTPQISGLASVSNWVNKGNGIWEGTCPNSGSAVNVVLLNGAFQTIGRYPNASAVNKGYLTFTSHVSNTQITDNTLTASPNWSGAQLVLRPNRWVIDRDSITLHNGNSIQYNSSSGYTPIDNFGYFIQNHFSTLDQTGEWFYNAGTKSLDMFFANGYQTSSHILASAVNNLIYLNGQNNIIFNNLSFIGANADAVYINNAGNITIVNCTIGFSGGNAISASNTTGLRIVSNHISNTSNTALALSTNCNGSSILSNVIKNTGTHPGMGQSGNDTYDGIFIVGSGNTIEYNAIDSVGYIGIDFAGDSVLIKNNFINHFTFSKDDGGGIYTWTGASNSAVSADRNITGNIVINGMGAGAGTDSPLDLPSEGIYMDDNTGFVNISGNTVANCGDNGIYIHSAHNITLHQNTVYNNTKQLEMGHDAICPNCLIKNNSLTDNIFFSKWINETVFGFETIGNDIAAFGAFDSNYYCRPYDDNIDMYNTYAVSGTSVTAMQDLPIWQSAYMQDPASKRSPLSFAPYTINSFIGSNMYSNGTFATDINGLYAYSAQNNVYTTLDNSGKLDGGCLKFYFTPNSGLANISKIIIGAGAVTAGKNYIVSFSLIGSKSNRTMDVFLRQSLSPYNNLSPLSYCKVSNTRSEVQFLVTPTVSEPNASLIFEIGEQDSTLWLDNIQMTEALVTMSNPDDNILFAYNPGSAPLPLALASSYIDVKSHVYSGSVTLAPYTSIILLKEPTVTNVQTLPLKSGEMNVYPNPAADLLTVSGIEGSETQVEIYDLSGRLILSDKIAAEEAGAPFQIDIHGLRPASYILKVTAGQKVYDKLFIKLKTE